MSTLGLHNGSLHRCRLGTPGPFGRQTVLCLCRLYGWRKALRVGGQDAVVQPVQRIPRVIAHVRAGRCDDGVRVEVQSLRDGSQSGEAIRGRGIVLCRTQVGQVEWVCRLHGIGLHVGGVRCCASQHGLGVGALGLRFHPHVRGDLRGRGLRLDRDVAGQGRGNARQGFRRVWLDVVAGERVLFRRFDGLRSLAPRGAARVNRGIAVCIHGEVGLVLWLLAVLLQHVVNDASLSHAAATAGHAAAQCTSGYVFEVVVVSLCAGQLPVCAGALHDGLHAFGAAFGGSAACSTRRHALDQLLASAAAQDTSRGQCLRRGVHQAGRDAPADRTRRVALRQLLAGLGCIFRPARVADAGLLRDVQGGRRCDHASALQRSLADGVLGGTFRHHLRDLFADQLLDRGPRDGAHHGAADTAGQVARARRNRTRRAANGRTGTRSRKGLQRLPAEVAQRVAGPIRKAGVAGQRALERGLAL